MVVAHKCFFCIVSASHRSVGTFARALDCSSSVRQPSLHMSAAAASRDITLVRYTHVCTHESSHELNLYHSTQEQGSTDHKRKHPWCMCVSVSDCWDLCLVSLNEHLAPRSWLWFNSAPDLLLVYKTYIDERPSGYPHINTGLALHRGLHKNSKQIPTVILRGQQNVTEPHCIINSNNIQNNTAQFWH